MTLAPSADISDRSGPLPPIWRSVCCKARVQASPTGQRRRPFLIPVQGEGRRTATCKIEQPDEHFFRVPQCRRRLGADTEFEGRNSRRRLHRLSDAHASTRRQIAPGNSGSPRHCQAQTFCMATTIHSRTNSRARREAPHWTSPWPRGGF
jgi:hypothetical protein